MNAPRWRYCSLRSEIGQPFFDRTRFSVELEEREVERIETSPGRKTQMWMNEVARMSADGWDPVSETCTATSTTLYFKRFGIANALAKSPLRDPVDESADGWNDLG